MQAIEPITNKVTSKLRIMTMTTTLSSALDTIQNLLNESVEDFKNHLNVNKLCDQLKNELFEIVEQDPDTLPEI